MIKYILIFVALFSLNSVFGQEPFQPLDVFDLEYTGDPQISPDGSQIVYRRTGFDILKDRSKGDLWVLDTDNPANHRKLTKAKGNESSGKWSPQGDKIAYVAKPKAKKKKETTNQIFVYNTEKQKATAISSLKRG